MTEVRPAAIASNPAIGRTLEEVMADLMTAEEIAEVEEQAAQIAKVIDARRSYMEERRRYNRMVSASVAKTVRS